VTDPVRIRGAGPSGLAAAITLARAGRAVVVYERRRDCGRRFGGDLQGLENWSDDVDVLDELASYGIARDFHAAPFTRGVQTNGSRADTLSFPRPAFYLVKRGSAPDTLDQSLKRQALAAGVTIHFDTPAPDALPIAIDASGPLGRTPFAVDTGIVFETDAPDQAVALLHDAAGLRGYSYLLITEGYGCCCSMAFDAFATIHRQHEEAVRRLITPQGITVRSPRRVGGVGHFMPVGHWMRGASRVVGEAAGLQDFLWGFGIRLAIRSGVLAARAVLEGREYAHDAEQAFRAVGRTGLVNRMLWDLGRVGDYRGIMALLRVRGPYPVLQFLYRDSWVQRALYPLAKRWSARQYPEVLNATP
jgi:flavin-dependent dehydrogenase